MSTLDKNKKVVTPRQSVHVVFFSCPNCGEETDHIHFCSDCGKPMRVIDVVEKFGEEAEEFMKKIQDRVDNGSLNKDDYIAANTQDNPNIIILDGDEEDSISDDGAVVDEDSSLGLDDIFPDDDDSESSKSSSNIEDIEDIVSALDEEEDEFPIDSLDGLGDDGLPEL